MKVCTRIQFIIKMTIQVIRKDGLFNDGLEKTRQA